MKKALIFLLISSLLLSLLSVSAIADEASESGTTGEETDESIEQASGGKIGDISPKTIYVFTAGFLILLFYSAISAYKKRNQSK
ncbi:MAG: hypothetical protein IKT34_02835 [Clostridia bacterium]|nr:hypothetical protein [Clostridia bacterium]